MLTFNLSSYRSGWVLVEAATLMVSLENISPQSRVRVSQVVEGGEIILDTVRTGEATGAPETTIKLDVSHALAGWLTRPHTNLGLRLSLGSQERLEVRRAWLVLETRESLALVRQRREAAGGPRVLEFQPDLVNSRTDCRRSQGRKNKCCR